METTDLAVAIVFYALAVAALVIGSIALSKTESGSSNGPTPTFGQLEVFANLAINGVLTADRIEVVDLGISGSLFSNAGNGAKGTGNLRVTSKMGLAKGLSVSNPSYDMPLEGPTAANQALFATAEGGTAFLQATASRVTNEGDSSGATTKDALDSEEQTQVDTRVGLQNAESVRVTDAKIAAATFSFDGTTLVIGDGKSGQTPYTSTDGRTFTVNTGLESAGGVGNGYRIAYSSDLKAFTCSNASNNGILHSTDGKMWTEGTATASRVLVQQNSWIPYLGLFVAPTESPSQRIATSSDGKTWTLQSTPLPESVSLDGIAGSDDLGIVVAVRSSTTGGNLWSLDGTTWNLGDTTQINCASYSPTLKKFLAFGTGSQAYTSTDGKTWTFAFSAGIAMPVKVIHWIDELQLFAFGGEGGFFGISTDAKGITEIASVSNALETTALTYVADLSAFFYGGPHNDIFTMFTSTPDLLFSSTNGTQSQLAIGSPIGLTMPTMDPPLATEYKALTWPSTTFTNYLLQTGGDVTMREEGAGTWAYTFAFSFSLTAALAAGTRVYIRLFNGSAFLDGTTASSRSLVLASATGANKIVTGSLTGTFLLTTAQIDLNVRVAHNDTASTTNITFYPGTKLTVEKLSNSTNTVA